MCDYLIIGGGPSALLEAKALLAKGKKVVIVAEQLGGSMVCMGNRRLQSYRHELALKGFDVDIGHYIDGAAISPLATEYMKYMASCIKCLPVQLVTGTVEMINKVEHTFVCHINTHEGRRQLITPNLILATGIMPRSIPKCFSGLTVKTCFEAYCFLDSKAVLKHKHKKVVILGGGNSAFQLARSAYEQGFHTTILAKKYLGLFPQETQDRFALRFPSQRTIEYIWKSQGDKAIVSANFLIYDAIKRGVDGIDVTLDAGDNNTHIAQASYQSIPGGG